jgi:hypothetical protein
MPSKMLEHCITSETTLADDFNVAFATTLRLWHEGGLRVN